MSTYARANTRAAWYQDDYPGAAMDPDKGVIHTTETTGLPGYGGGATAPNYTAVPNFKAKRLEWFAHFPDERSGRALKNTPGGVETNTDDAIQVELVGTCDPRAHRAWGSRPHIYWADPPDWAIRDLAHFIADIHKRHGVPVQSVGKAVWTAYPESYGAGGQRLGYDAWRRFRGWLGHQHVPENTHGDPGAFPWGRVREATLALLAAPEPPAKAAGSSPGWDSLWETANTMSGKLRGKAPERERDLATIKALAAKWSVKH